MGTLAKDASSELNPNSGARGWDGHTAHTRGWGWEMQLWAALCYGGNDAGGAWKGREKQGLQRGVEQLSPSTCTWVAPLGIAPVAPPVYQLSKARLQEHVCFVFGEQQSQWETASPNRSRETEQTLFAIPGFSRSLSGDL